MSFKNCHLADFTDKNTRQQYQAALDSCWQSFPLSIPVVISGVTHTKNEQLESQCPSDFGRKLGSISMADTTDCDRAMAAAWKVFPRWRTTSSEIRAALLEKIADRLEADRFRLAALINIEIGKSWFESDAELGEAVDFCRYYAQQVREELCPQSMNSVPGENNQLIYEGRGPTVVISPWNFPLAILCGMAAGALAAGNPVIFKPAEQSSIVAYALFQHFLSAGCDPELIQFLPGSGETVGRYLVAHPHTATIAFTGSKQVGQEIYEKAAIVQPGQVQMKKVVCEMGGKNAIIIDDDADLDEAVSGVMKSAFGYSGQKCSACSRAVVVGKVYDPFVERLIAATRSLKISESYNPSCSIGPVIDKDSHDRLLKEIAEAQKTAQLLYLGEAPRGGYFVPPAIFSVEDIQHTLLQDEKFGPIVAVKRAANFQTALEIANSTQFALTGAVYSRTPSHIELAREQFRVGNLYINRGSTGAFVYRQPFGGFGMSGTGAKAGGPGYLRNFVDSRLITENTMRRGFTPELDAEPLP